MTIMKKLNVLEEDIISVGYETEQTMSEEEKASLKKDIEDLINKKF